MKYLKYYREMHAQKLFKGMSLLQWVPDIAELITEFESHHLLDYGCGLGWQYTKERVHVAWGRKMPTLYDPAVDEWRSKQIGQFDGVICTDVLEHVPEDELEQVVREIANYARDWAFISVCCRPSKHIKFPNGQNVHVTIHPFTWWQDYLKRFFRTKKLVLVESK